MRSTRAFAITAGLCAWTLMLGPAWAQTFNSGSTGADGPFNPSCTPTPCTVTQTLPPSGIFNFTTINIATGITVKFTRNQANTPVMMLATGDVTLDGTIDLSGAQGGNGSNTTLLTFNGGAGGPGGSDGGRGANGIVSNNGGAGLGPGGGTGGSAGSGGGAGFAAAGEGGALGGPMYGTASLLPLIGGSGGGGGWMQSFGNTAGGGGGGGGALLIAASGTITVRGTLRARGGDTSFSAPIPAAWNGGGGSGGAIRLVATAITGTGGTFNVSGGTVVVAPAFAGATGRIRVEAFTNTLSANFGTVAPGGLTVALPSPSILPTPPTLRIASVAGVNTPPSPGGLYSSPDITLPSTTTNPVTVALSASRIPLGTQILVTSKGLTDTPTSTMSTGLTGTVDSSTATASLSIPLTQPTVLSATVAFRLIALGGAGPVYVQGEEVVWVRVTATLNGPSQVTYITRSGREIALVAWR